MNVSRFASQLPRSMKYRKVANKATRVQTRNESANSASADLLKDKTITSIVSNSLLESVADSKLLKRLMKYGNLHLNALKTLRSRNVRKIEKWKKLVYVA